jgi:hypothetical protein
MVSYSLLISRDDPLKYITDQQDQEPHGEVISLLVWEVGQAHHQEEDEPPQPLDCGCESAEHVYYLAS